jgi:hypothetical protein
MQQNLLQNYRLPMPAKNFFGSKSLRLFTIACFSPTSEHGYHCFSIHRFVMETLSGSTVKKNLFANGHCKWLY